MTDIVERLREQASFDGVPNSLESEAADEIERLMAEHDDYVIRANANVCELNREIERLRAALQSLTKDPPATLDEPDTDDEVIIKMRAIARDALRRDDGTVIAVGGEPGASAGSSE